MMEMVDSEIRRIIDEAYQKALGQLQANRDKLEALTQALLVKETLEESDAYEIAGIPRPANPNDPMKADVLDDFDEAVERHEDSPVG
jgi:cell division protease FtsH